MTTMYVNNYIIRIGWLDYKQDILYEAYRIDQLDQLHKLW